jgi:hypothetical protein
MSQVAEEMPSPPGEALHHDVWATRGRLHISTNLRFSFAAQSPQPQTRLCERALVELAAGLLQGTRLLTRLLQLCGATPFLSGGRTFGTHC